MNNKKLQLFKELNIYNCTISKLLQKLVIIGAPGGQEDRHGQRQVNKKEEDFEVEKEKQ